MLRTLSIKNLALIKQEEVEFSKGLNIILGETGAGKSLIFDALFFVLSIKTDRSLLRNGEESMRVDAEFCPVSEQVHAIMQEFEVDDEALVISRVLHADGKTSTKINGAICPQLTVKKLASLLVDSLMQHENMELLKSKNHLALLDNFCSLSAEKQALGEVLSRLKTLREGIKKLGGSQEERAQRMDFLQYQIDEIERADIKPGEDEEIEERLKLLENSESIVENVGEAVKLMESGTLKNIALGERLISKFSGSFGIDAIEERMQSARLELEDICSSLKDIVESADADPIELERLNERKDKIKAITRKSGGSIEKMFEMLEKYRNELDELAQSEQKLAYLNAQIAECEREAEEICLQINKKRQEKSIIVKQRLEKELGDLGMKNARFEVDFSRKAISPDGYDDVKFIFSANKGQPLKDLATTASGGESSRIMLAMKNIFASALDERTLLFDEIDSGISGEIGNMMAAKLQSISRRDQVIAITHLPQVASAGDRFLKVEKFSQGDQTLSSVKLVEGEQITVEIAHIIGGNSLTESMKLNARELYERAHK